ncbi:hypothetical protein B2H94_11905 [Clostridium sporogenes]|uniref:asparagine synthase (glutamine-hydrolyzing) n=2 Tax=Clostridium sporogenes TaxID=1509 RepID=A0ABD6RNH9_CLOSG|nr:hypothetical protein B2H94_11905 [Clostridium sporogenes]
MNMIDREYCNSAYLAFRWIPKKNIYWSESWKQVYPKLEKNDQVSVKNSNEVNKFLNDYLLNIVDSNTAIFLSGGIDSAILASYLPKNMKAYTIKFSANGAIDESIIANKYAEKYKLNHKVIQVTWDDYKKYMPMLMKNKKAPLHPVEVALYKASMEAKKDGVTKIILGNGADSTFGGMDKLLSEDWSFDSFVKRYNFIDPYQVLKEAKSILNVYEEYRKKNNEIDYISFLKYTHGLGIVQAFANAIEFAGCTIIEPFEHLKLTVPLDFNRIRNNEPKYILYELFREKYPYMEQPRKIPFTRPMDRWLKDWNGPNRKEFLHGCIDKMTGDQKYLIYSLEMFLNLIDK